MLVYFYWKCRVVMFIVMYALFANAHAKTYIPWDELTEVNQK